MIVCWLNKVGLLPRSSRHVKQCAACAVTSEVDAALENALRNDAPSARAEAPTYLHQRIMAHVDQDQGAMRERGGSPLRWVGGSLAAVAVVLIAIAVVERRSPAPQFSPGHHQAVVAVELPSIPKVDPARVERAIVSFDQPLRQELTNVVSDSRRALGLLAYNFLPNNTLRETTFQP